MNNEDIKELCKISREFDDTITELDVDRNKAHTMINDISDSHFFFVKEKMSKDDLLIFQKSYTTIQTKLDIVTDYTFQMGKLIDTLVSIHSKLHEFCLKADNKNG